MLHDHDKLYNTCNIPYNNSLFIHDAARVMLQLKGEASWEFGVISKTQIIFTFFFNQQTPESTTQICCRLSSLASDGLG